MHDIHSKQVQTARSEAQSPHTCPCISDRQLQLQSHGPGLSAKTTYNDTLMTLTSIKQLSAKPYEVYTAFAFVVF